MVSSTLFLQSPALPTLPPVVCRHAWSFEALETTEADVPTGEPFNKFSDVDDNLFASWRCKVGYKGTIWVKVSRHSTLSSLSGALSNIEMSAALYLATLGATTVR